MRRAMPIQSLGVLMVATVITAGLYGVSHTVATERQALADARGDVRQARADIRRLKTELGTRASLRQLERWNAEVLGLGVPGPGQFVTDAGALASLDRDGVRPGRSGGPPIMVQAAERPEAPAAAYVPTSSAPAQYAAADPVPVSGAPRSSPVASDVSVARVVVERRRQREAMMTEERARPKQVALAPAPRAVAQAPRAIAEPRRREGDPSAPAARPERSERLAEMERRLAVAVGGEL